MGNRKWNFFQKQNFMDVDFLKSLFPNVQVHELLQMKTSLSIEEIVNSLIESESDSSEWQDLITLKETFPSVDETEMYDTYMEKGMDGTMTYYFDVERELRIKVILPKHLTANIVKQDSKMVSFLSSMFPMFDSISIESVMTKFDGDIEQTITLLSEYAISEKVDPRSKRIEAANNLRELFPNFTRRRIHQLLNRYGTLEACIIHLTEKTPCNWALGLKAVSDPPVNKQSRFQFESAPRTLHSEKSTEPPQQLRKRALDYLEKRNECFRIAAAHYQQGSMTGRASAVYYSEQGHMYTELMKKCNENAAHAIFYGGISTNGPYTIDLHGLTVKEAKDLLSVYILTSKQRLKIITGAGNHSKGGGKLFVTIQAWFRDQAWRIDEGGNGWFFARK
jgi:hypothetical protein